VGRVRAGGRRGRALNEEIAGAPDRGLDFLEKMRREDAARERFECYGVAGVAYDAQRGDQHT